MTIRWTREEALAHGWKQDKNGEWFLPRPLCSHSREVPKPEPSVCVGVKKEDGTKEEVSGDGKYRIVVIAYCRRHTDPDNLCPKWYIDEIVRAGIMPDDSSKFVESVTKRVVKIEKGDEEKTVVEIWRVYATEER